MKKTIFIIIALYLLLLTSCQSVVRELPVTKSRTDLQKFYSTQSWIKSKVLDNILFIMEYNKLNAFDKNGQLLFNYKTNNNLIDIKKDSSGNFVVSFTKNIIFLDNSCNVLKTISIPESFYYHNFFIDSSDNLYLQSKTMPYNLRIYNKNGILLKESLNQIFYLTDISDNRIYAGDDRNLYCLDLNFKQLWKTECPGFYKKSVYTKDSIYILKSYDTFASQSSMIQIDKLSGVMKVLFSDNGGFFSSINEFTLKDNKIYYLKSPNIYVYDVLLNKNIAVLDNTIKFNKVIPDSQGNLIVSTYNSLYCLDSNGKTKWVIKTKESLSFEILEEKIILFNDNTAYIVP